MAELISLQEARARLTRAGFTLASLAKELGVHPNTVHYVLNGKVKGNHGDAHRVAVALGVKDGVILPEDMSVVEALRKAAGL